MRNTMIKKYLAILLVASMVIQPIPHTNEVRANELDQNNPNTEMTQEINEAINVVNDLYSDVNIEDTTDQEFGTKTLILSTEQTSLDLQGADAKIELGENLYALTYPTPADAKAAYDTYSQMDGILFVEPDTVIGTQEEGSEAVAATEISLETENSVEADTTEKEQQEEQIPTETEPAAVETETETATEQQTPDTQTSADALPGQTPARIAVVDTGIDVTMEKAQPYLTGYNREGILAKLRQFFGGEPDTEGFVSEEEVRDENGHGSQVTGLIADALAGDGIGGDQAEILPVKVAGADGRCTVLQLYLGIERAIALQSDLINVSMGAFATTESAVLTKAADDAAKAGITMVVSAGNNGSDVASYAPANIPSVITAGSIDRNSQASDFSNHGGTMDCVSYGEDLVVTGIGGQSETVSGTSYAAALVTAELAKQAVHTVEAGAEFTPELADAYISQNAVDLGDPGWDAWYGYGLIGSYEYPEEPVDADTEKVTEETETGTEDTEEPATEEADSVIPAPDNAIRKYADSGQLTEDEKREMYACLSFGDIGNDINCIAETENIYAASVLAGQVKEKAKAIGDEIRAGYVTSRYFDGNGFVSPVSCHKTGMEQTDAAGEELMQTLLAYGKSGSVEDEEKFEAAFDKFYHTLNAEKEPQAQAQSAELTGMLVAADEKAEQTQAEEAAQEEAAAEADTGSVDASVQSKTDVDGQADAQADPVDDTASIKTERIGKLAADDLYGRLMEYPREKLKQFYEGLSDSDSELLSGRLGARYQEVMERIYAPEVSVQSAGEEVRYVGDEASLRMYMCGADDGEVSVQSSLSTRGTINLDVKNNITVTSPCMMSGNLTIKSTSGKSLKLGDNFRNTTLCMIYTNRHRLNITGNVVFDGRNVAHEGFGIWNTGTLNVTGTSSAKRCVFRNFRFLPVPGGTLLNGGYGSAIHNENTCTLENVTFTDNYLGAKEIPVRDNSATNGIKHKLWGGGAAVCSDGRLTIKKCTFTNNYGVWGGAVWVHSGSADINSADIDSNIGCYGSVYIGNNYGAMDSSAAYSATCYLKGSASSPVKIHGDRFSDGIWVADTTGEGRKGRLVIATAGNYIYGNSGAGIHNDYRTEISGDAKIGYSSYSNINSYTASENKGGALVNTDSCTVSAAARFFGGTKTAIENSGTISFDQGADAAAMGTSAETVVDNRGTFTAKEYSGKYSLSVFSASSTYGVKNTGTMTFGGCVDGTYSVGTSARGGSDASRHAFANACIESTGTLNVNGNYVAKNGNIGVRVDGGNAVMTSGTATANSHAGFYISQGARAEIQGGYLTANGTNGVSNNGTCDITGSSTYSHSNGGHGFYNAGTCRLNGTGIFSYSNGSSGFYNTAGTATIHDGYFFANGTNGIANAGGTCNITGNARVGFGTYKSMDYSSGTPGKDSGYVASPNAGNAVSNGNSDTTVGTMEVSAAVRVYSSGKTAVANSGTLTFKKNADACLLATNTGGSAVENSGTLTAEGKDTSYSCNIIGSLNTAVYNTGSLSWGGCINGSQQAGVNGRIKTEDGHTITIGVSNNSSKKDNSGKEITACSISGNALITNCGTGVNAVCGKAELKQAEIRNNSTYGICNQAAAATYITGADIHDNTTGGSGAGIYNYGKLYFNSGLVCNNKAHAYGGGIMNKAGADFRMYGGVISGNKAEGIKSDGTVNADAAGGGIHNEADGEVRLYGGYIHGNDGYGISNRGKVYIATQNTPSDNKNVRFHMGVSSYDNWQSYTPSANTKGNIYNEGFLQTGKADAQHTYARLVSNGNTNIYNATNGTVNVLENTATANQTELYGTGTGIYNNGGTVNLRTGLNITSPSAQSRVGIVNAVHENSDKTKTVGTVNVTGGKIEKGSTGISNAGTVTMSKGTITGNSENGVTNNGTFTMTGGTIEKNSTGINNVGTVTMSKGTITGNSENGVINNGTFTLTGGTISKNTGHGVTQNGTFNMSGAAVVDTSNDVCLAYGKVITVKDKLTTSGVVAQVTPVNKADANDDSAIVLTGKGTVIAKTSYSGGKGSAALFYDSKQSARFILSNGGILRPGDYMDQEVLKEAKKSVAATDIAISEKYGITYDKNLDGIPVSIPKGQSKFWCENVKLVMANPTITDASRAPEFQFLHWNDKADDTGSIYVNGQTYKKNNSVTIYAQWQNNINFAYIGNEQEQGNDYMDELISQSEEYTFGDNQDDAGNEYFDRTATKSYTDEETGSEVEQEVECTVVGWRLGNKVESDSYLLGQQDGAGKIYKAAEYEEGAITYGAPSGDYGSHNPVDPFQMVTPEGNGQAVAGTLTGADSIMQKNFLSPFMGGIPYINLYAVWDEGPVVEAYDLYYDLSFAQSTTDTEGITMAELLSHAEARDVEDGTLAPGADIDIGDGKKTSFIVMDYQISDFTGFTTDGTVSVTYQATDSAGNVTRKRINVHVIDTTPQDVKEGKVRFISNKYLDKSEADGGLAADSVWNTRSDYHDLLAAVLSNEKTGVETADGHYFGQDISIEKPGSGTWTTAPEETWEFTHEQVQAVKAYIDANGIGNSKSDTALSGFTSSFASCKK